MLFPLLDREIVDCAVEQLDTSITRCCDNLVFMDLRPGQIVEGVLRCEPNGRNMSDGQLFIVVNHRLTQVSVGVYSPFHGLDPLGC